MTENKIACFALTNVGKVRKNNEDNYLIISDIANQLELPEKGSSIDLGPMGSLIVVADGMGGTNAGEVASGIAIDTIKNYFTKDNLMPLFHNDNEDNENSIKSFMEQVIKDADINIKNYAKNDTSTSGMGTTIVMAWILGTKLFISWCGDSRCYVYNRSMGMIRLSKDHSYVQELVDKGEISEEEAFDHPYSNIITRCLGDQEMKPKPDFRVYHIQPEDTILLCSDGLSGVVPEEDLVNSLIATESKDITDSCNELVEAALNNGGYDNITVALARILTSGSEEKSKPHPDLMKTIKPGEKKSRLRLYFMAAAALAILMTIICLLIC